MQMQTNKVKRMLPSVSYVIALWRTAAAPNSCEKRRNKLNATAFVCSCLYVSCVSVSCFSSAAYATVREDRQARDVRA
jgi:hypothetical protein